MKLRLRAIIIGADFRRNELTLYEEYRKRRGFVGDPKVGDTHLFVSRSGSQLLWVLRYEDGVTIARSSDRRRIESLRMRISGGRWNPAMLANYASDAGIELQGLKRFEETYAARKGA